VTGYSQASAIAGKEFMVMRKSFDLADLSRAAARLIAFAKQPEKTSLVRLGDGRDAGRRRDGFPTRALFVREFLTQFFDLVAAITICATGP
jgi:hypothetical protein